MNNLISRELIFQSGLYLFLYIEFIYLYIIKKRKMVPIDFI